MENHEFSSDREYYGHYLKIREGLIKQGWKEGKSNVDKKSISVLYTKDGYGIYVLYGCEEEIKNEIL